MFGQNILLEKNEKKLFLPSALKKNVLCLEMLIFRRYGQITTYSKDPFHGNLDIFGYGQKTTISKGSENNVIFLKTLIFSALWAKNKVIKPLSFKCCFFRRYGRIFLELKC